MTPQGGAFGHTSAARQQRVVSTLRHSRDDDNDGNSGDKQREHHCTSTSTQLKTLGSTTHRPGRERGELLVLSRTHNSARGSSFAAVANLEQNPLPAGKRALARSWTCLRFLTSFVALQRGRQAANPDAASGAGAGGGGQRGWLAGTSSCAGRAMMKTGRTPP